MSSQAAQSGGERAQVLGAFLERHWRLPIAAQGTPPDTFSPLEASLEPSQCGACHPKQYAEWSTSLHAGAFSPGFAGQLIEGDLAVPAELRNCQTCHAPLAEQQPFDAAGATNAAYDPELRSRGIACAACHVRGHRRFGPPPRPEAVIPEPAPHGGFEIRTEFQESRFCAECHQFFDDPGVAGKPIQNTFREWQASPQAAAGRACQSCHMPDRAHLWRGIHDEEMVRAAVDVELFPQDLSGDVVRAAVVLRNRDVGHAFPTYVTPRVSIAAWQVDASGTEIPETRVEAVIGRSIDFGSSPWREELDTRVAPGDSVRLDYGVARARSAESVVARVTVDPDHHYRGVFASLLESFESPRAQGLIAGAYQRTRESSYVLWERRQRLE
jgi:hypothetical protein